MRVVMDEAGDLPVELLRRHHIDTIPINIMFGVEQYLSNVDIDQADFYEKTSQVDANNFPKTSQPTPYQFAECFKRILAEGEDEILTIVVGRKLSGTYASAVQAAQELTERGIFHVFDSMSGSAAQGFMALEAARMIEAGNVLETILARLEKMRDQMSIVLTIDSLEYAVKGGRVSFLKSLMASLLNIKPILTVQDGLFVEAGKVRTRKKALANIVNLVKSHVGDMPCKLAVIHANSLEDALQLQEMAKSALKTTEEILMEMSIPVAINLGPGALGIVAIPETRNER